MNFCKHALVVACLLIAVAACSSDEESPAVASPSGDGSPQAEASTQAVDSESPVDPTADHTPAALTSSDNPMFRGEPENQPASRGATDLTIRIFANDLPSRVAILHVSVRYDSKLLVATSVTCGSASAGHIVFPDLSIPGYADVGCTKVPADVIYSPGDTEVATVTFDATQGAGQSLVELAAVELLDVTGACLGGWSGSRCQARAEPLRIGSITIE